MQFQILVCFALEQEAKVSRRTLLRSGIKILLTGIGRQNAERAFRNFLARFVPQRVFTCGFAGGLNPDLKPGDVVFELSTLNSQPVFSLPAPGPPNFSAPTALR